MTMQPDGWIPLPLRDWTADVRFACRLIWRERWFSLAAISTVGLALGIGTTVYTVVNAMILRGLPVAHPDRIVMFTDGSPNTQVLTLSYRDAVDWREATASFAEIGLYSSTTFTVGDDGRAPDVVGGSFVSANIFRVVEQAPLLGRDFLPSDDQPGAARVVMLGYSVWASRFARSRGTAGADTPLPSTPPRARFGSLFSTPREVLVKIALTLSGNQPKHRR
jgi:hypothetical protein